jgi:hypothetical protein
MLNELCARTYVTSDDLINGVDRIFKTSTSYCNYNLQVSHILCILETKTQLSNHNTKFKLWRLPKIKASMERWSPPPFGPAMYVRRGGLWAKHTGLKRGVIGTTLGEHIGNLGNPLGTKTLKKIKAL